MHALLGIRHDSSNEQGGTIHSKGGSGMFKIIGPWGPIILLWTVWGNCPWRNSSASI